MPRMFMAYLTIVLGLVVLGIGAIDPGNVLLAPGSVVVIFLGVMWLVIGRSVERPGPKHVK
jgi:hypothetical protein